MEQQKKTQHEQFVEFVGGKTTRDVNLLHCMKRATGLNVLYADFEATDDTIRLKHIRFTEMESTALSD